MGGLNLSGNYIGVDGLSALLTAIDARGGLEIGKDTKHHVVFGVRVYNNHFYAAWETVEEMRAFRGKFGEAAQWALAADNYLDRVKRGTLPKSPEELEKILEAQRHSSWNPACLNHGKFLREKGIDLKKRYYDGIDIK